MAKRKPRRQYQKPNGERRQMAALMIPAKLKAEIERMADAENISVSKLLADWLASSLTGEP